MYLDGTGGEANAKTFLTSPEDLPPLQGVCFMFYYTLFVSYYGESIVNTDNVF